MRATALLCGALCATALPAQQLLWERTGSGLQTLGGYSSLSKGIVANLGDLDGDACEDLIVAGADLTVGRSQLWLLSGRDGSTIRTVPHTTSLSWFLTVETTGDMNPPASGRGTPDYMVLIRDRLGQQANRLEVRSGADDSVLWAVERPPWEGFGTSLLGDVDLDGDGLPDVVATLSSYWAGARVGAVFAYRNDGSPLWQVLGTPQLYIGAAPYYNTLGKVGDLDQDGCDDVVVGGVDATGAYGGFVLSGRTGEMLVAGLGPPGYQMGECCDGLGDVDGDSVPDFAVGSYYGNLVLAFSGRTGAELYRWQ